MQPCWLPMRRQLQGRLSDAAEAAADADRRAADRQRAFNLLHADFAAQRAAVEEAEAAAAAAAKRLAAMQGEAARTRAAAAAADRARGALEHARMEAEDLAGAWMEQGGL